MYPTLWGRIRTRITLAWWWLTSPAEREWVRYNRQLRKEQQ